MIEVYELPDMCHATCHHLIDQGGRRVGRSGTSLRCPFRGDSSFRDDIFKLIEAACPVLRHLETREGHENSAK